MERDESPAPRVLVLAGTTGSGKSTVAGWLAEAGALVVDADKVGHELLRHPDIRLAVVGHFGREVFDEESEEIDRRRLGARVFTDPAELEALNAIVHPVLVAEIAMRVDHLRHTAKVPLIVVDAALWLTFDGVPEVDLVLGLRASPEVRVRRIQERDGLDAAQARARIESQSAIEASLEAADALLDTDAPPNSVRALLFALLHARLGVRLPSGPER